MVSWAVALGGVPVEVVGVEMIRGPAIQRGEDWRCKVAVAVRAEWRFWRW